MVNLWPEQKLGGGFRPHSMMDPRYELWTRREKLWTRRTLSSS